MIVSVAMTERDWTRVLHAVESSYVRKTKRGDHRGADEMMVIGRALMRQCRRRRRGAEKESSR